MLSWLTIVLGLWWVSDGGEPEYGRVLWADGGAVELSFDGDKRDLRAGDSLMERWFEVDPGASVWLLDPRRSLVRVRGPGAYLSLGGLIQPASSDASPVESRSLAFVESVRSDEERSIELIQIPDGVPGSLVDKTPRATRIVDTSPVFRWTEPPGTSRTYELVLEVRDRKGRQRVVERWQGIRGGVYAPQSRLQRGLWYRWTLTPTATRESPGAIDLYGTWFQVIPSVVQKHVAEQLAAVELLVDRLPSMATDRDMLERIVSVLRIEVLEAAGLYQSAEDGWNALVTLHPQEVGLARRRDRMKRRLLRPSAASWQLPTVFGMELL